MNWRQRHWSATAISKLVQIEGRGFGHRLLQQSVLVDRFTNGKVYNFHATFSFIPRILNKNSWYKMMGLLRHSLNKSENNGSDDDTLRHVSSQNYLALLPFQIKWSIINLQVNSTLIPIQICLMIWIRVRIPFTVTITTRAFLVKSHMLQGPRFLAPIGNNMVQSIRITFRFTWCYNLTNTWSSPLPLPNKWQWMWCR